MMTSLASSYSSIHCRSSCLYTLPLIAFQIAAVLLLVQHTYQNKINLISSKLSHSFLSALEKKKKEKVKDRTGIGSKNNYSKRQ